VKSKYLSKAALLSCLLVSQLSATDYKKVVLASFNDETRAQAQYDKLLSSIESTVASEKEKYSFDVVMRPAGNHYIITAEPFAKVSNAKEVLQKLKHNFPTAYINNSILKDAKATQTKVVKLKKEDLGIKSSVQKAPKDYSKLDEYTIEDMLQEIVYTDPEIRERLFQYKAIEQDINISDATNYPKIDFIGKVGKKRTEKEGSDRDDYDTYELTLRVVQNLFNGFGSTHAVNRDEARTKAAFNKYIEVAQEKMYRAVEAYIKVLRYNEVLKIAKENVRVHEETLLKIQKRYDKGFSTLSEVERVKGRLALSKSNYVSETNNLYDAKFNFHKALGRNVDVNRLVMPQFKGSIPKTLNHAQDIAIHENPSILVANYDIKGTQESLQYARKNDYPTLDLELQKSRYNNLTGSSVGREDDESAMLVLNYNLYSGGADKAEKQKYVSLLNYEYAHKNKLKRDVMESLALSWSAYKMTAEQYKHQVVYRDLTAKTKEAYTEEFQLGRRTLIDLLDVQDEVNNIRIRVIHTTYDMLFAKYRISDAMGTLYKDYAEDLKVKYKEDILQSYVDQDNDKILDTEDQCDNSETPKTNIYGCQGVDCVQVDEIEFNKVIKDDTNQLDTTEVQNLWGIK